MPKKNYDLIIYQTLTNPYARLVEPATGCQADIANSVLSRVATWGDTDIALSKDANIGGIPITIPTWLPEGVYDLLIYDAASPAAADVVKVGYRIQWHSNQSEILTVIS